MQRLQKECLQHTERKAKYWTGEPGLRIRANVVKRCYLAHIQFPSIFASYQLYA